MPGPWSRHRSVATDTERTKILDFFRTLPVVLEHDALRVVHACWDDRAVEVLRRSGPDADVVSCLRVADDALRRPSWLAHRTLVPKPISIPFGGCCVAPEIPAFEGRRGGPCVHHGGKPITAMIELVSLATTAGSFWGKDQPRQSRDASIHSGECSGAAWASKRTICVDFGISRRWSERLSGRDPDLFQTRLAAFRWPEEVLVDDLGHEIEPGPADAGVFPESSLAGLAPRRRK